MQDKDLLKLYVCVKLSELSAFKYKRKQATTKTIAIYIYLYLQLNFYISISLIQSKNAVHRWKVKSISKKICKDGCAALPHLQVRHMKFQKRCKNIVTSRNTHAYTTQSPQHLASFVMHYFVCFVLNFVFVFVQFQFDFEGVDLFSIVISTQIDTFESFYIRHIL